MLARKTDQKKLLRIHHKVSTDQKVRILSTTVDPLAFLLQTTLITSELTCWFIKLSDSAPRISSLPITTPLSFPPLRLLQCFLQRVSLFKIGISNSIAF